MLNKEIGLTDGENKCLLAPNAVLEFVLPRLGVLRHPLCVEGVSEIRHAHGQVFKLYTRRLSRKRSGSVEDKLLLGLQGVLDRFVGLGVRKGTVDVRADLLGTHFLVLNFGWHFLVLHLKL